jgi:hypothetical protein
LVTLIWKSKLEFGVPRSAGSFGSSFTSAASASASASATGSVSVSPSVRPVTVKG